MSSITLSAATRQNLLSLQDTANLLSTTQSRLSTGKKVTSALDNPTNFFTSQSLTARSSDLSALMDGISNGIQTIQAASQGISSIQKLIDTAKSTAQQAIADKTGGGGGVKGGATAQAAKAAGTATLDNLGTKGLDGSTTFDLSSPTKDASLDISLDGGTTKTTIRLDSTALANTGLTDLSKLSADDLLKAIDSQIAGSGLAGKVKASIGDDGRLGFATTATGSSAKVSVAASGNATVDIGFGVAKTPPKAATVTANAALGPTADFGNGGSASFTVFDGSKTVTVKLDKDTVLNDSGSRKLVDAATGQAQKADIVDAINYQLGKAGSTATVRLGTQALDGSANVDKLVFVSGDTGPDAQLSVTGGTDTTTGGANGTGIGFNTFTAGTNAARAPTDLPSSASTAGAGASFAAPAGGTQGSAAFGKILGAPTANTAIVAGLSTTFTVNTKQITIDSTSAKSGGGQLGNAPANSDIIGAINKQLADAGLGTVTASLNGNNSLTFTDANRANPALAISVANDQIGLMSTPSTVTFAADLDASTNLSSNGAEFTIGGKTIKIDANSPAGPSGTLGANGSAVTREQIVASINEQLRQTGTPTNPTTIKAYLTGAKLTFVDGEASSGTALAFTSVSNSTPNQGLTATGATQSSDGAAAGTPTTTPPVKASITATNALPTLSTLTFGTGQQTTFKVGTASVTLDGNSSYNGSGGKLSDASLDGSRLASAINLQLQAQGSTAVASVNGSNQLVFSDGTGSATAPSVATSASPTNPGLKDQLGLFGTPAKTSLGTNLNTAFPGGNLAFGSGQAASFTIGSTQVTINGTTANGSGGTLSQTPTLAAAVGAINSQLSTSGYSAYIDSASGRLTFVGPNSASAAPTLSGVSDTIGFGFGTAATTTAGSAAAFDAVSGKIDLSGGKSASFTIGDGTTTSRTITINAASVGSDGLTKIGSTGSATKADVLAAIQYQLDNNRNATTNAPAAIQARVSFDQNGALTVTSNAVGASASVSLNALSDDMGLGLGRNTAANGTFAAGSGTAADAVTSSGSDATDGSSTATIVGGTLNTVSALGSLNAGANASFDLKLGSNPAKTINVSTIAGTTLTAAQLVTTINQQIAADTGLAGKVQASINNGKLQISTTTAGSDQKLTLQAKGTDNIGFGTATSTAMTSTGTDVGGSKGASSVRQTLASQFNDLLGQISQQARDSSYNGINLLFRTGNNSNDNTLHIALNEKNTSAVDVKGVRFDADGLGLNTVTGGFQTDDEITSMIEKLNTATNTLRTQSSTFGANLSVVQNRQEFSKALINILDTGAANLTNADMNEEAANSQALSTRNSLAVSALSLANQAQQGILQLLR
ncbi:flagellin [Methylobacterium radiodurans]|uniref:Flagellin n=1 Tax=Methylobacterium radiodurans TaxID=2202828 RepID=A0A2U8VQ87_9HYPH|nr:flagellin [Methylobacterium radiodurans]AWN35899.1 hypothetical protein DK427_09235 [Methylobacterium radiodurans]